MTLEELERLKSQAVAEHQKDLEAIDRVRALMNGRSVNRKDEKPPTSPIDQRSAHCPSQDPLPQRPSDVG